MSATDVHVLAEEAPLARVPWLTPRRAIFFVIGWLMLFALIGAFLSNPFRAETGAAATPSFFRVMFLHGLLVGVVALGALVACQVFQLSSRHVRVWILVGALAATVPVAIGGLFDRRVPGAEVPMWIQITGFFALDEILLVLLFGFVLEWRRRASASRGLPLLAALLATASMFLAAVIGHLAGWILEFGNTPGWIDRYARYIGTDRGGFTDGLIGSHSHQMAVAVMALVVALAAQQFRYAELGGPARLLARIGLAGVAGGTIAMSGVYEYSAFGNWEPPAWFTSHGGTNGIASDDVITGVLVMGGGLLVLLAFVLARAERSASARGRPLRLAAVWSWVLSFATVVVGGYAIELSETHFGAGDPKAAGAAGDAVFTWLHQDFGLFLLPALVLVMLVVERLIAHRYHRSIALATAAGSTVAFVGVLVWVFVDSALHGPGYDLVTVGLAILGGALLATMWWGTIGPRRAPAVVTSPRVAASAE
jgi:hypothetical protein